MTEAITVHRPAVAKAEPATVSASALALHLDCSQTYIRKLEAEGVLHRAPGGSVRLRRADGEFRWYHVRGEPLRDRQGRRDASSSSTAWLLISMKPRRPKTGYAAAKPIGRRRSWSLRTPTASRRWAN
jgi:hypothetical protein